MFSVKTFCLAAGAVLIGIGVLLLANSVPRKDRRQNKDVVLALAMCTAGVVAIVFACRIPTSES